MLIVGCDAGTWRPRFLLHSFNKLTKHCSWYSYRFIGQNNFSNIYNCFGIRLIQIDWLLIDINRKIIMYTYKFIIFLILFIFWKSHFITSLDRHNCKGQTKHEHTIKIYKTSNWTCFQILIPRRKQSSLLVVIGTCAI